MASGQKQIDSGTESFKQSWDILAKPIRNIYANNGGHNKIETNKIEADIKYLGDAYLYTEARWQEQLRKIVPKVILLSEAPLFGENKNYFYNPDTAPSGFFWFNDAEPVAGKNFALGEKIERRERKQFLLKTLSKNGFLILDLFPYALNDNTALSYKTISKENYLTIFKASSDEHLSKKLDLVKSKCKGSRLPLFLFRYKRLKEHLDQELRDMLVTKGLLEKDAIIDSIGGKNMSLDRDRFWQLVMEHRRS
jgi:hypothetical protein